MSFSMPTTSKPASISRLTELDPTRPPAPVTIAVATRERYTGADAILRPVASKVLYVHHRGEISGAARSLAGLIEHLDDRWAAHVLTPPGPAARLFAEAGAAVTTARVSLFQHTWD